jgi:hypothetical protein
MTAFWDTASSSLVEVNRRFGGAYCLYNQGDNHLSQNIIIFMLVAARTLNLTNKRILQPSLSCS